MDQEENGGSPQILITAQLHLSVEPPSSCFSEAQLHLSVEPPSSCPSEAQLHLSVEPPHHAPTSEAQLHLSVITGTGHAVSCDGTWQRGRRWLSL